MSISICDMFACIACILYRMILLLLKEASSGLKKYFFTSLALNRPSYMLWISSPFPNLATSSKAVYCEVLHYEFRKKTFGTNRYLELWITFSGYDLWGRRVISWFYLNQTNLYFSSDIVVLSHCWLLKYSLRTALTRSFKMQQLHNNIYRYQDIPKILKN